MAGASLAVASSTLAKIMSTALSVMLSVGASTSSVIATVPLNVSLSACGMTATW